MIVLVIQGLIIVFGICGTYIWTRLEKKINWMKRTPCPKRWADVGLTSHRLITLVPPPRQAHLDALIQHILGYSELYSSRIYIFISLQCQANSSCCHINGKIEHRKNCESWNISWPLLFWLQNRQFFCGKQHFHQCIAMRAIKVLS